MNNENKTFNDIFGNNENDSDKEEKVETFYDLFEKQNREEEKIEFPEKNEERNNKNSEDLSFNSLFDESNSEENKSLFEEAVETTDEESKEENTNPFFEETVETTEEESKEENTNPFFEETVESSEEESKEENANPFFEETIETTEEKNKEENIEQIEVNIFDDKDSTEKEIIATETNSEIKNILESKNDSPIGEEPKDQNESPFFNVEANKENNSILLNNLNLVETNKQTSQVNLDLNNATNFNVKVVKKKEPLGKFILGVISYAIFILLLLIGITLLAYVLDIKIRAAKGDYSSPKYNAYVVLTGSMLPEIQVKDVVVTKKVDESTLEEGDVITFSSADTRFLGTIITHRIIKKTYDAEKKTYSFQTKGDYNNVADSAMVPSENIFGKVILKVPKLGYLQDFLASKGGWIIVILFPCLAVMSYDIVKLAKGLKKKKLKGIKVQSR